MLRGSRRGRRPPSCCAAGRRLDACGSLLWTCLPVACCWQLAICVDFGSCSTAWAGFGAKQCRGGGGLLPCCPLGHHPRLRLQGLPLVHCRAPALLFVCS